MAKAFPPFRPPTPASLEELRHEARETAQRILWPRGLSVRLLILTVLFVVIAGLLIMVASLATLEDRWLADRVTAGEGAILTIAVSPDQVLTGAKKRQIKESNGIISVKAELNGVLASYLAPSDPLGEDAHSYVIDLRGQPFLQWLTAPVRTLTSGPDGRARVIGHTPHYEGGDYVEIVVADASLKKQLVSYLLHLLWLTGAIAGLAGLGVYVSLNLFLVRPIRRITLAMERFRADPDDPASHIDPSGRRDEVGRAEVELNLMQADLRAALSSRARLAALGEAVAKINHDLRNMLTSAQIASERLAMSGDPQVAAAMPRLERALDRAARLTSDVLAYGKTEEPVPNRVITPLKAALDAAAEDAGLAQAKVKVTGNIKGSDEVLADPDQLHRILLNLLKNARQAITSAPG
ncbi:MAG: two-component sensor histidine kinase, partial [Caulobacteraceae bacterium]|nr:two-component sensor histidine kinase [Caulobacteraceae bacterium]